MELFRDTKIDFLRVKWICIGISWALIVLGFISIVVHGGLRFGIDFSGGTQIVLKFATRPDPAKIESILKPLNLGLEGVQRYDDPAKGEVLIKVKQQAREGRDVTQEVFTALAGALGAPPAASKIDVNVKGHDTLATSIAPTDPDNVAGKLGNAAAQHYAAVGDAIVAYRSQIGLFKSAADFDSIPNVSPAVKAWLKQNTVIGPFTVLSADNVGPQVGRDLRTKALWAVLLSTIAMLLYIWFRFDVKFGVGAIVAIIHDTLITIGLLSIFNREITLVVVAALLTLVGYSMNDTVVVYDRIRENLKTNRRDPLPKVINDSINQTLSRTVMSSGLTFLVVVALFFLGGEVLNTFALTLVIGIIVGTYSSIYVAAPIVVIWNDVQNKRRPAPAAAKSSKAGKSGKR
ncbi:MAG: protein translocase subunit SecF [Thermoanaerobaculia bacterium]